MASEPIPFPQTLLARAHSPATAATHYTERVAKRPLYVRATSPTPSARAVRRRTLNDRKERSRKRSQLKPRPLSAAKKRALGLLEIPKEQQKYNIYKGLHGLWVGYMREILGLDGERAFVTAQSGGQMLVSADLHGAILEVVRSRCVSRVGVKGIVVRDTKFTFEIIMEKNTLKSVPKEHTVFRFEIPLPTEEGKDARKPLVFEILGEEFQARAPDRANRKFKMHYQPDI
ncbi:RNase P/MRP, p29 subunit [Lentithecium fluviatile CBS 122367]|uniref:Ribonuclease P protein subunit n=1 Tax=Lentithecium fluviatile CBS 122367 TaxID=1168545 RepID=A0A6G1JIX7_9PLEO|nr:RNase P/MRP, p29 subunit [Lentithecium fluviatile CBS 122367]